MSSLLILIPLSIVIVIGAVVVLLRAIDAGQFEDLETPALLPVVDADPKAAADTIDASEKPS